MNITDYIVESLKKGKTVEIAGIGQWTTREEAAHHDPQSHTFYPRRKVVEFTPQCKGDKSFVEYIASQECVGTNVADQMVKNYADTLTERMKAQGKVEINGLGTLGFGSFTVADSLNLGTDDAMAPIDGIKTYQTAADDDPFAAFEQPLRPIGEPEPEPVEPEPVEAEPEVAPEPEADMPEPVEAEPEVGTEPEPEPVEEQPVVEEPVAADPEPAVAAAAVAGAVAASSLPSPDETVQMTKKEAKSAEKRLKEEQKRQKAEEKAKEKKEREESIRKQEELKAKEKAAKKEAEEAKKRAKKEEEEAKKKAKAEAKAEAKATKKAKKEEAKPVAVAEMTESHQEVNNGKQEGKKKKKSKVWLWILLAILALLLAAVLVFLFVKPAKDFVFAQIDKIAGNNAKDKTEQVDLNLDEMVSNSEPTQKETVVAAEQNEATEAEQSEEAEEVSKPAKPMAGAMYSNAMLFTYSEDLVGFTPAEIDEFAQEVTDYMIDYLTTYLAAKKYTTAKVPLTERVKQYATTRLTELLDVSHFEVERLVPSDDYLSAGLMDYKRMHKSRQKQVMVQSELLDGSTLDGILNTMVEELGLKSDVAKVVMPPAPAPAPQIPTASKSRKGFDLIAGYYVDKNVADQMYKRLKGYGCNAYIIEINHGYYVSMGSAATQTEADAMLREAKKWYDGDLSVRKNLTR